MQDSAQTPQNQDDPHAKVTSVLNENGKEQIKHGQIKKMNNTKLEDTFEKPLPSGMVSPENAEVPTLAPDLLSGRRPDVSPTEVEGKKTPRKSVGTAGRKNIGVVAWSLFGFLSALVVTAVVYLSMVYYGVISNPLDVPVTPNDFGTGENSTPVAETVKVLPASDTRMEPAAKNNKSSVNLTKIFSTSKALDGLTLYKSEELGVQFTVQSGLVSCAGEIELSTGQALMLYDTPECPDDLAETVPELALVLTSDQQIVTDLELSGVLVNYRSTGFNLGTRPNMTGGNDRIMYAPIGPLGKYLLVYIPAEKFSKLQDVIASFRLQ